MLVTQGFGWITIIPWGWLALPLLLWFVSACIISYIDSQKDKKGLPNSDKTGTPGWHTFSCIASMILIVAIPLVNVMMGMGPHYGDIADDIENQFNLQYVKHVWIGEAYTGQYKWIAKDPEGLFVMCNTEKTKSEDTFKLVCDSGKDYSKGLPL